MTSIPGLHKDLDTLEFYLKFYPDDAKKLLDAMILQLWRLRSTKKTEHGTSYRVASLDSVLIDEELLHDLVQWSFNKKKSLVQIIEFLQEKSLRKCPICCKWTKELHEIKTALYYLWSTYPKGMNDDHGDVQQVCGWCHDYITDQSPPDPDGDDSDAAYEQWLDNQPDYQEDYY